MDGQKELRSKKFQELLTEIGHELQPRDVESFKDLLKKRLPTSVWDDIDSRGRNSGLELLKKLQEEGHLAEDNLKLLRELFQTIERSDLLEKLFQFEKKVKELGKTSSEVKASRFSATRDAGSSVLEERITGNGGADGRASLEKFASDCTILDSKYVRIGVKGGFHDLSSLGVLLQIPPNAVTRPTKILCVKISTNKYFPTEENETLVSYCVRIYSISAPRLQKPIIVTLKHSGPSKKEGYETIVKAWKENNWKQIQEIQEDTLLAREHFESGFIEVEISEWTALAVVTRLITNTFEVTDKGCVVRSSVFEDVTVEFPEGAVDKKCSGSMKLLMMPDHIDILDGIAAYPCPLLLIDGFEGVSFKIPVKIRLPHPHPAGYPSGNVRLLTMDAPHEWKDITDQVNCVETESLIEVQVSHFSGLWVWIYDRVPLTVVSSLSQHLFKVPQEVCFAVFKENEVCSDVSLTMTLVCVPNHLQFEKTDAMKKDGYTKLASSTGNKRMRPDDKAYTKVEGCYKKKLEEDNFLRFIENDIFRKELPLRKTSKEEPSADSDISTGLVISFLEKKDGDTKDNLCKLYIDETEIITKQLEEWSFQEVETVGPERALPGPSGTQGHELSLPESSAAAKAQFEKLVEELNFYKTSMKDPPPEAVKKCRNVCQQFTGVQRKIWIEELRKYVPSGTTGPLEDGNKPYEQLDAKKKQDLTRALCGQDVIRRILDEFGKSKSSDYYDRQKNPVEVLLEEESKKRTLTVGELYDVLVKCEANAVADDYL